MFREQPSKTLRKKKREMRGLWAVGGVLLGVGVWLAVSPLPVSPPETDESARAVIVQGQDAAEVAEAVRSLGRTITHKLEIIDAVGAQLTQSQLTALGGREGVLRIYPDTEVLRAGGPARAHRAGSRPRRCW